MQRFLSKAVTSVWDPLKVSVRWSPEEAMIQEMARKFCQQELKPKIKEQVQTSTHHETLVRDLGELGLLGLTSQEGPTFTTYGLVARELEAVDSAYRSAMSVQSSLVIHPIHKFGTERQHQKYLPGLFDGTTIGAFGLTEPMHGSDPGSMKTSAVKDGNKYVLNGEKMWITNAPLANVFVVWAQCDETIQGFVVERDDAGVSTPKIDAKASLQASCTGQIVLEDVVIPADRRLNVEGLKGPFSCLNQARFGISWGVLGAASDCLQETLEYADARTQFGKSLTEFQLVQKKLADLTSQVGMSLAACQHVAEVMQAGETPVPAISMLKGQNCQLAMNTALQCRDILGGNGIVLDYSPIRHLMNLQSVTTYEGTTDIHSLIVGRSITGANAFF